MEIELRPLRNFRWASSCPIVASEHVKLTIVHSFYDGSSHNVHTLHLVIIPFIIIYQYHIILSLKTFLSAINQHRKNFVVGNAYCGKTMFDFSVVRRLVFWFYCDIG